MKLSVAVLCCCLPVVLLTHSFADEDSAATAPSQFRDLMQRIEALEARVNKLERQRPAVIYQPRERHLSPLLPGDLTRRNQQVPDQWTRHGINGMTYYIVPLQGDEPSRQSDRSDSSRSDATRSRDSIR